MKESHESIPERVRDSQQYWLLPAFREATCPECKTTFHSRPKIIYFKFRQHRTNDVNWPDEGWLVWHSCCACPVLWRDTIASDEEIIELMRPLEWENLEADDEDYSEA